MIRIQRSHKVWIIGGVIVLFLPVSLYCLRNQAVRQLARSRSESFKRDHRAELTWADVYMSGSRTITVERLTLKPDGADTLLTIGKASARLKLWKLLTGTVAFSNVELEDSRLSASKADSSWNFDALFRSSERAASQTGRRPFGYSKRTAMIFDAVFERIPVFLAVSNLDITWKEDRQVVSVRVPELVVSNSAFLSRVEISEDTLQEHIVLEGQLDSDKRSANIKIYSGDGSKVRTPYVAGKWRAVAACDTLQFSLTCDRPAHGAVRISGLASVDGLVVNHPRIAADDVVLAIMGIRYQLNIGEDFFEVDSLSEVTFNEIRFNPYMKLRMHPSRQITLRVRREHFPAQDLFSSLPAGLFYNLQGIRTEGNLSFYLDCFADLSLPDSLIFKCTLRKEDFRIRAFGNTDFTFVNEPFEYTVYDGGEPVRTFVVGPENPRFRTLDRISPYLRYAVLTSEDGSFFSHRGFNPEAFRQSVAANIRERRFVRGGSTVTMQLVKNLFLIRRKTIARKLEEVLITWLIENNGLITKERIYEVYLNIIEWGPGIYGADEASRFYFAEDPSELTLAESIFLASIVPHPRSFTQSFDTNGELRGFLVHYYADVSRKMLHKGWLTQEEVDGLRPEIDLRGPAQLWLERADTTVTVDSIGMGSIPN